MHKTHVKSKTNHRAFDYYKRSWNHTSDSKRTTELQDHFCDGWTSKQRRARTEYRAIWQQNGLELLGTWPNTIFWNILRTCAPLPPLTGQGDCSTIALDLERRFAGWKQRRALVRQRTVVMLNVGLWHHFSKIPYSSFGFINRACYALTSSFNHQHVLCFNMTTPNQ